VILGGDPDIAGSLTCLEDMMLDTILTSCKYFLNLFGQWDDSKLTSYSASVYSSDLYQSRFAKDPMNGEEGRRYRKLVLGRGGSRAEMELLEEYLGRKPNGDAFAKAIGG